MSSALHNFRRSLPMVVLALTMAAVASGCEVGIAVSAPTASPNAPMTAASPQVPGEPTESSGPQSSPPNPAVQEQATAAPAATTPAAGFRTLFNGQNLDGWYTYTPSQGKNNDTEGVFTASGGELRILDVPQTAGDRDFGYLATNAEYSNYVLRLEYKWGAKKFAPRANAKRDSGVLYHMTGADKIWPTSSEIQVQEGDTGDYISLGPVFDTETTPDGSTYQAGGTPKKGAGGLVVKSSTQDSLTEWNTVEVVVDGANSTHRVNGVVVNRVLNQTLNGEPLTTGRIALQAEGAEVTYRNIQIKDLSGDASTDMADDASTDMADDASPARVLAFSKAAGFRHSSISTALSAIDELGVANSFAVDRSENAADFTDANLARYDAVVFVSATGDVLNDEQQAAMERYIRGGGGYAGIHAAADAEYDWPWYGELVGAYFSKHPEVQPATIKVEDRRHPSTQGLAQTWVRTDEWYDFRTNPRSDVTVLLSLDENSYSGGGMGADHPIAWYHAFDGGRSWYTGLGHTDSSYAEPEFRAHLLGGIQYAIGRTTL
ncbi:MAG: ThuA domain-containing protein [Dermatophilaceae bacterium]